MTVGDIVGDAGSRVRNLTFDEITIFFGPPGGCPARGVRVERRGDLIQTHGSIELPAAGRWGIPGGQRLDAIGRWPRTRRQPAFTTGGRLDIPTDPQAMRLDFTLALSDHRGLRAVRCETRLVEADRYGRWTLAGTVSAGGQPLAGITLAAWYHGVYDHGARPVVLLSIGTRLPTSAAGPPRGRPGARVDLVGDINVLRLYSYPARPSRPRNGPLAERTMVSATTPRSRVTGGTSRTG